MESLGRREPISLVEIWKNTIVVREGTDALLGTTEDRRKERKGMGAWAAPREDELGKVRYKPEELGLYIDDPHATLKPEQQRLWAQVRPRAWKAKQPLNQIVR